MPTNARGESPLDDERERRARAITLYRDGRVSLGKAAQLSGMPLADFIDHLDSLGLDIVRPDEMTSQEADDVSGWLSS